MKICDSKENRKLIRKALNRFDNAKLVSFSENYATFICGCKSICAIVEISFNFRIIKETYITDKELKIMSDYAKTNNKNYFNKDYKKYKFEKYGVKYGLQFKKIFNKQKVLRCGK